VGEIATVLQTNGHPNWKSIVIPSTGSHKITPDHGIPACGVSKDARDLSKEKTECIEKVKAGLEDKETLVVPKKGLTGEVGIVAPAIAQTRVNVAVEDVANRIASMSDLISRYHGCPRQFS
jgi:hypothetical protein